MDVAEILNGYFACAFQAENAKGIIEASPAHASITFLNNCYFTENNIPEEMSNIKVNITPVPGRITLQVLKETKNLF